MNEGSLKAPRCNTASATTLKADKNSPLWCSKLLYHKFISQDSSYAVFRETTDKQEDFILMKKYNIANIKVLVFAGVLTAMSIILTRVIAIPIGTSIRLSVGQTPVYLCGFWFGPLVGGICGFLSDFLGAILQGYAPNPMISLTAILAGVLPGLFRRFLVKKPELWRVLLVIAIHGIVGSLGFTCLGLHMYYGTPWAVLYAQRAIQTPLLVALNAMLVFFLYKSPLTAMLQKSVTPKEKVSVQAHENGR